MYAKLLADNRIQLLITPEHPRFEELSPAAASDKYDRRGLDVILGPEHPRYDGIARILRYGFDPNEPRDASGKWTHGERANSLHEERQALKQKRKALYKEVRADARAAKYKIANHIESIMKAHDELNADETAFDDIALGDLENGHHSDQLQILKETERAAKTELAKEAQAEEARIGKELGDAYYRMHQLADSIPEGLTADDIAQNHAHLRSIMDNASAARALLPTYIQHRKEMAAIRHGKPMKVKAPKTPPGDDSGQMRLFQRGPNRYARDMNLRRAIERAAADTDTSPTELQRKVGNYRKGHVSIQGLDISIENPKGSTRSGTGKDGNPWSVKMKNHYGYIKCAISEADGDHVDVFVGPRPESEIVFVIDQVDGDWQFDEHKCMIGWTNADDAKRAYHANYSPGWYSFAGITAMTMDEFKRWIAEGDTGREASKASVAMV